MEPVSRRFFFQKAGATAAVVGAATVLPLHGAGASTAPQEKALTPDEDLSTDEHLVAHVINARTGEISLFIGQREVTIHDRKVAARLVRAAR